MKRFVSLILISFVFLGFGVLFDTSESIGAVNDDYFAQLIFAVEDEHNVDIEDLTLFWDDISNLDQNLSEEELSNQLVSIGLTNSGMQSQNLSEVSVVAYGPGFEFDVPDGGSSCDPYYNTTLGEKLTQSEVALVLTNPLEAILVNTARNEAIDYVIDYYGENEQGDISNAFLHGIWSALITKKLLSRTKAERWTDAHENKPYECNDQKHMAMDLFNNEVGRNIAWNEGRYSSGIFKSNSTLAMLIYNGVVDGEFKYLNSAEQLIWTDE